MYITPFPYGFDRAFTRLIVPSIPNWHVCQADFSVFSEDAIDFLYPGKYATAKDALQAIHTCTEVRQAIRSKLKLPQN